MLVNAVLCESCKDLVYSRAEQDIRYCSCGRVGVKGGHKFVTLVNEDAEHVKHRVEVEATERQLIDDWRSCQNVFGVISGK
jgi:ribosomal protein L37AE/L43A